MVTQRDPTHLWAQKSSVFAGVPGRGQGSGGQQVPSTHGVELMSYPRSARVTYNLHRGKFSVSRRERVIVFSGATAGRTESAVMRRLKDLHGEDVDLTLLKIEWG